MLGCCYSLYWFAKYFQTILTFYLMNKKESLKLLSIIRFPSGIELNYEKGVLYMWLSASSIAKNMQEDASAFESWIFCLKFKEDSELEILKVQLDWEKIPIMNGHYRRFLYRAIKFIQICSPWFDVDPSKKAELLVFSESLHCGLFLNYPINDSKKNLSGISESSIEESFVTHHELYKGVRFDVQNNQLPVGIFEKSVSRGREFFTAGKSAIDLWGIKNDEFWIFELKYQNRKVGILSELLFYMWVMEDVFLLKTDIYYPDLSKSSLDRCKRSFNLLYKHEFEKIIGVLLIDSLHPLVNKHVIMQINALLGTRLELKIQKYEVNPLRLV